MDTARYQRNVIDAALSQSVALPAAGASSVTPALDLGAPEIGPAVNDFDVLVTVDATPNLAVGKNVSVLLQDSADGQNFAPIGIFAAQVITGPANGGGSATPFRFNLPATVRQFIQAKATVDAAAGDNTGANITLALAF